jgi:hypothetical protein
MAKGCARWCRRAADRSRGRRARTDLLTKKLEELYLALNDASAHNLQRHNAAKHLAEINPFTRTKVSSTPVDDLGLDLHKRIVMYVRLYFPKLAAAHQAVFIANRDVNRLIYSAETGPPLPESALKSLSASYGDSLRKMETEIITNRAVLVREGMLPRRYTREA